jgi:hypothetical protein
MTCDSAPQPFIATFASRLDGRVTQVLRYDPVRQISQIHNGDGWMDAVDSREHGHGMTRMTKVFQESTDDE